MLRSSSGVGSAVPLPSKNEIWSARVAHLARHARHYGTETGPVATDMAKVWRREQDMIDREVTLHLDAYKSSGYACVGR